MVEPTGYSALDIIGFTDRGDYAAGSTYVKNDLVHYNDNIWKCKYDDTTGQTPAEGTYWTLWIDGNTNLSDLSDTAITSPSNGDVLEYDSSTSKWKNSGALGQLKNAFTNQVNSNGSKNLLPLPTVTKTISGTTINVVCDDTGYQATASSATSSTYNDEIITLLDEYYLPAGTYMFSVGVNLSDAFSFVQLRKGTGYTGVAAIFSGQKDVEFTLDSEDIITVLIRYASGKTVNQKIYPMISLKTDYDLDDAFEPYAKTNRQLTEDSVTWPDEAQIGAVNYLENTATSQVDSPVTWTVNSDKTVTATVASNLTAVKALHINSNFTLKKGIYRISGCPSGGSLDKCRLQIYKTDQITVIGLDIGNGVVFTLSEDTAVIVVIRLGSGLTAGTYTFKPMIAPVSYKGPYVIHAKTNKELTDDVSNINGSLERKLGFANCPDASSVFDLNISGGHGGSNTSRILVIASYGDTVNYGFIMLGYWANQWNILWKSLTSGMSVSESNKSSTGIRLTFDANALIDVLQIHDVSSCNVTIPT